MRIQRNCRDVRLPPDEPQIRFSNHSGGVLYVSCGEYSMVFSFRDVQRIREAVAEDNRENER